MNTYVQLIYLSLLIITFISALPEIARERRCSILGGFCDRTIFFPCCGRLVCKLHGFANGTCVKCLETKFACLSNAECCSGVCHLVKCQPKKRIVIYDN
ncbi:UPF0506 protein [Schistosoma japonicum]|nr:UPF0506 protein [Schistosoma japonicum]